MMGQRGLLVMPISPANVAVFISYGSRRTGSPRCSISQEANHTSSRRPDRILILIGVLGLVKDDICGNAESDRCENRKNYADWYVEEIEII
jgi:hypothetical protein